MQGAREIEVKYQVHDVKGLEDALTARGLILSAAVRQEDQAYAEAGWSYGMSKIGVTFARLRTQGGKHLFTLKRPVANEMDCEEYECEAPDRDQVHDALLASGFRPTVRINKARRTAARGRISLCLDEVEDAGSFVEIERVVGPSESGTRVQAQLDQFVRTLGVALERTTQTYDSIVRAGKALPV